MVISRKFAVMGAVIAALAIGIVAYGLNQYIQDRSTGLFSVDVDEAANLSVEFFGMTPGSGATTDPDWCQGDATSGDLHCVAKISSTTTTITQDVMVAVTSAAAGPGNLRDDLALSIFRIANPDGSVRDNCRAGSLAGWTQVLAPTALSALPATTPYAAAPAAANHVCFVVSYTGEGYGSTPGTITTSASLRVTGTAQ